MKSLFFLLILSFSQLLQAGTISFTGACSEEPLLVHKYKINENMNVGSVTVQTLDELEIPYIGAELGMNSIFETPTGLDAMDIVSKTEMFAYGWCYSINGVEPNVYPNEIKVTKDDNILWWFGYAHYLDGEWVSQCELAHEKKSELFCEQENI